ncbi:hypothetical protein [Pseudoxanthomonas japonensis]|uniref:hypothetical protein n=1 Tax=Pseudoxanthomonas japonensis TaxID=69284 RepID=UPI001390CF09|nr:hypothetical protein [Pseudoxanthomonas japonensis]
MNRLSRVTNGVIKHRLLERARDIFVPLCRDASDGLVLLLLGPTQSGKSIIFHEIVTALKDSFQDSRPGAIPIVSLQIETVSEGRAKAKWIGIELLKSLEHPIYKHIGGLDENEHYFPSRGRDESTIRIALKEALSHRFTRRTCLDEAHLLTRTKDPELRAAILESIKSTCAIDRTLIASGGYEMAYKGLFDSSHFCGRVLSFNFGHYGACNPDDLESWARILKTYSGKLELSPKSLLLDEAVNLLHWNNGTVGLLDKHLWSCSVQARARHMYIDRALLRACAPPERERKAIAEDIRRGEEALQSSSQFSIPSSGKSRQEEEGPGDKADNSSQRNTPFQRAPNRNAAAEVVVHDDD